MTNWIYTNLSNIPKQQNNKGKNINEQKIKFKNQRKIYELQKKNSI